MRNGLVLALDRTGCLQTARWSDVSRGRARQSTQPRINPVPESGPDRVAKICNDAGLREVPVFASTVVCAGESPPEDHPHVTLRMARNGRAVCPYCGTQYRFW